MNITLVQSSIKWLDAAANRAKAELWLDRCMGSRLVIFSEMFTTGFTMEPERYAERDDATLNWMKSQAAARGVIICGSVAIRQGEHYYNRLYVVSPDGSFSKYDKHHLFTFAGEDQHYKAGEQRIVVEIDGVRILLLVCYDLRFPVWGRNRGDYDMILCVAAWSGARRGAWDALLRARAIENVAYTCGVNIVGSDPTCSYSGGTAAIDFRGGTIASVEDNMEGVVSFELDMAALSAFRAKFTALEDMDDFKLYK